jgi:hypothetical protein
MISSMVHPTNGNRAEGMLRRDGRVKETKTKSNVVSIENTVLLKSIRQSRVLDVTNFATLSRITQALDEHTFRHGRFKISVQGCWGQFSSAVGTPCSIYCPFLGFLASNLTPIVIPSKFNSKKCIVRHHSKVC